MLATILSQDGPRLEACLYGIWSYLHLVAVRVVRAPCGAQPGPISSQGPDMLNLQNQIFQQLGRIDVCPYLLSVHCTDDRGLDFVPVFGLHCIDMIWTRLFD